MQPGLQTVESMGCFLECPLMTRIDNDDDGHHHHHQSLWVENVMVVIIIIIIINVCGGKT